MNADDVMQWREPSARERIKHIIRMLELGEISRAIELLNELHDYIDPEV